MIILNNKEVLNVEDFKNEIKNKNVYEVFEFHKEDDTTVNSYYFTNYRFAKDTFLYLKNNNQDKHFDFDILKLADYNIQDIIKNF